MLGGHVPSPVSFCITGGVTVTYRWEGMLSVTGDGNKAGAGIEVLGSSEWKAAGAALQQH